MLVSSLLWAVPFQEQDETPNARRRDIRPGARPTAAGRLLCADGADRLRRAVHSPGAVGMCRVGVDRVVVAVSRAMACVVSRKVLQYGRRETRCGGTSAGNRGTTGLAKRVLVPPSMLGRSISGDLWQSHGN